MGLLTGLFDTSGFPARWQCGSGWRDTPWLGWLHILSDLGVWSAYIAIPCVLIYFVLRRRDIPFRSIFLLFGGFILACGTTHLMEAIIFWWPLYPLAGFIKLFTAIVSWATVIALIPITPKALAMRSPDELEREVTARRLAEEALQRTNAELEQRVNERTKELMEAERRWRSLAEALPNLVWTDSPDGQCDYLSSQWGIYTGVPEHELLGLAWLDRVVHPDDRERTLACWMAAVEDNGIYDVEYRIRRHDGEYHWFKTRGVPIRDEQGRIVKWFGTCTDIEDRKRAEEALRATDRRKDEFLATLAHELRNPLAPLRNSLEILKMPNVDAQIAEQVTGMMERQLHHLVRLVDDLLDVSRVMRGSIELRKERVDLAAIVSRGVETVQPHIEAQRHELTIALPSEPLIVDADPVRLVQVVGNLLTNSAKYTEENGHVWVAAYRQADRVILSIRDNGIGIAPDMLLRIFDLFVQVDQRAIRSQGGLGIGLTLVKNLVEMHQGTVTAHSAGLGQGSEFIVELPLAESKAEISDQAKRNQESVTATSSHSILVVDDNRDAAESLSTLLSLQGHDVKVAHDGPSALELAASFHPAIIFLDIGMPVMNGYEVARRLRSQSGLEKVILVALTGWGQQNDRRRSAEAGFDHHLVKPPESNVIQELLKGLKR